METTYPPEITPAVGMCFVVAYLLIILLFVAFTLLVFCKIFSKAGYHWAMGLLVLVPVFGQIIVLLVLAFGNWPILRQLQALRHSQMAPPPPGQPHESFRNV
jgi:RsiW-degrading membrane proteinase PrsW (M82 family)